MPKLTPAEKRLKAQGGEVKRLKRVLQHQEEKTNKAGGKPKMTTEMPDFLRVANDYLEQHRGRFADRFAPIEEDGQRHIGCTKMPAVEAHLHEFARERWMDGYAAGKMGHQQPGAAQPPPVRNCALMPLEMPRATDATAVMEMMQHPAFRGFWRSREIREGWSVTFTKDGDYCEVPYEESPAAAARAALAVLERGDDDGLSA